MMSDTKPVALPSWLKGLGSAFLIFHFVALGALVLGAPSNWGMEGEISLPGPEFARATNQVTYPAYLRPLRMSHNYHFQTNQPAAPGVRFEILLYERKIDDAGNDKMVLYKKLQFPESVGNPWVRHRLERVAQNLFNDIPVQIRFDQVVLPPGPDGKPRKSELVEIWADPETGSVQQLKMVNKNLVPRTRPVYQPSDWAKKLAEAYVRYQFRLHGSIVAEGELIRVSRQGIPPPILLPSPDVLPARGTDFPEIKVSFGKIKNETPAH